jgi:putative ABC transport system permease protein
MALNRAMTGHRVPLDVIAAARSLRRSPGFTIAAVLSLALSIGAGVIGFGVIDAVRFRALPFPNAERLVLISETPKSGCPITCPVDYKTLALLREHRFQSIDALAAFVEGPKAFGSRGDQFDVTAGILSKAMFGMLGVRPEIGRIFTDDEDRLGAEPVMLISHDLWATYFGSDSSVLGKSYRLSEEPFTVIGVMPPNFNFETKSQVWLAASRYLDPRTGTSLRATNVLARLVPGATIQQLAGELSTLQAAANQDRTEKTKTAFTVAPLRDRYVAATRSYDLIFALVVVAILLIGCANVASLVLVRATRRSRELAIRSALGAGRRTLLRFVVVENALLCLPGLIFGLLIAWWSLSALRSLASLQATHVFGMEYRLDGRVLVFAVLLTVLTVLALSIAPARLLMPKDLQRALREGGTATGTRVGNRTHQAFVITQTACSVALLIATGLMARTIARVTGITLGYDAEHAVSLTVVPVHSARRKEVYLPITDRVLSEISAMRGVDAAAVRMQAPFAAVRPLAPGAIVVARDVDDAAMTLDNGQPVDLALQPRSAFGVSVDYFTALGIPLIAGRTFTASENESSAPVAVINEWAARHWWPKENAVGHTFSIDTAPGARAAVTVVGVVRDNLATEGSVLLAKQGPQVYRPFKQSSFWIATYFIRSRAPAPALITAVQRAVMRLVPANGQARGRPLSQQIEAQIQTVRTNATQIGGLAVVGLLLAVTGLYGVLSYVVQQRTQEIGIRAVLGADRTRLLAMVLGQGTRLALAGIAVGVLTAALSMRLLKGILYGTATNDIVVYAIVCGLALFVAFLASYLPARRASRIDPAIALRTR